MRLGGAWIGAWDGKISCSDLRSRELGLLRSSFSLELDRPKELAYEQEPAPFAITELDLVSLRAADSSAGPRGLASFEVDTRDIWGQDLASRGAGV